MSWFNLTDLTALFYVPASVSLFIWLRITEDSGVVHIQGAAVESVQLEQGIFMLSAATPYVLPYRVAGMSSLIFQLSGTLCSIVADRYRCIYMCEKDRKHSIEAISQQPIIAHSNVADTHINPIQSCQLDSRALAGSGHHSIEAPPQQDRGLHYSPHEANPEGLIHDQTLNPKLDVPAKHRGSQLVTV